MASKLATICLQDHGNYNAYSDKDLENGTLIFSHFLMDVVYTSNKNLTEEKMLELAETTGKAIRELILAATGKDMHEIAKS